MGVASRSRPPAMSCPRPVVIVLLLCPLAPAFAAEADAPEPTPKGTLAAPTDEKWEGAIGPVFSVSPDYQGSARRSTSVVPGFYLRRGRLSISNQSGFVTRRSG